MRIVLFSWNYGRVEGLFMKSLPFSLFWGMRWWRSQLTSKPFLLSSRSSLFSRLLNLKSSWTGLWFCVCVCEDDFPYSWSSGIYIKREKEGGRERSKVLGPAVCMWGLCLSNWPCFKFNKLCIPTWFQENKSIHLLNWKGLLLSPLAISIKHLIGWFLCMYIKNIKIKVDC